MCQGGAVRSAAPAELRGRAAHTHPAPRVAVPTCSALPGPRHAGRLLQQNSRGACLQQTAAPASPLPGEDTRQTSARTRLPYALLSPLARLRVALLFIRLPGTAVFYFSEASTPHGQSQWLIWLQGGGWCWSSESCVSRGSSVPGMTTTMECVPRDMWHLERPAKSRLHCSHSVPSCFPSPPPQCAAAGAPRRRVRP